MKFDRMKPNGRLLKNAVLQKMVFCMRVSAISMGVLLFTAQLLNASPGGAQELDNVMLASNFAMKRWSRRSRKSRSNAIFTLPIKTNR
jgi:hypothetical protein